MHYTTPYNTLTLQAVCPFVTSKCIQYAYIMRIYACCRCQKSDISNWLRVLFDRRFCILYFLSNYCLNDIDVWVLKEFYTHKVISSDLHLSRKYAISALSTGTHTCVPLCVCVSFVICFFFLIFIVIVQTARND